MAAGGLEYVAAGLKYVKDQEGHVKDQANDQAVIQQKAFDAEQVAQKDEKAKIKANQMRAYQAVKARATTPSTASSSIGISGTANTAPKTLLGM